MMGCGHAANATDGHGRPCCVICHGIKDGANRVVVTPPDFTGRRARCSYRKRRDGELCTAEEDSSPNLAFFAHRPNKDFDEFYCGCWGWD